MPHPQPEHDPLSDLLGEYVRTTDWPTGPVFPSKSSLDWFVKRHRRELVTSGALITREGRAPSLLHKQRFPEQVCEILQRESLQKQSA